MPQSGATTIRSAGTCGSARRMRSATVCGVSTVMSERSMTPRMIVFDGSSLSTARSSFGCAASIETCCAGELLELRQERIARRLRLHHLRIAEAQMHRGGAGDAVERAVERRKPIGLGLFRPRLHPRLVELHDVGAGREQVLDLGIHGGGIVERQRRLVAVVVVLALLRHGERARHRHLDHAVGIGAQEFDVAHLDRMAPSDLADHARHDGEAAGAVRRLAGIVEIDAVERGREAVGIALAPLLAVGDDVEAGALLVADGEERGVVLRRVEPFGIDAPQLPARARAAASAWRGSARSISQSGCG